MIQTLYSALIAPLEEGMLHALSALAAVTGSWGFAIVLLSVGVNLALLPFYHIAERWHNVDREIQERLRPKLQQIKSAFKGDERFMMTKTLYRQAGYHPFLAIRSVAGFLIQIPVFLAAYYFLLDFHPIAGVGFGPFTDLSRPDGLLRIGNFSVNVMPLVMTVVNVAAVSYATSNLARKEKIQLWVVAAVFLLLLYTMPLALVLYWTTNNLFSFFNGLVTRKVVNYPSWVWVGFELAPICGLFVVLVSIDPVTLWQTSSTLGVKLMIAASLYALLLRLLRTARFRAEDYYGMKRLLPLAGSVVALLVYVQADSTYDHNLVVQLLGLFLTIAYFALAIVPKDVRTPLGRSIFCSALALSSIMFVFNPLLIYFASPDDVGTMNGLMMVNLFTLAALATFLLLKAQELSGKFLHTYAVLLGWAASAGFIYSYVAIVNYGLLRGGRFTEERVLLETLPRFLPLEMFGLLLLGVAMKVVIHRSPQAVPVYSSIVLVVLTYNLATAFRGYRSSQDRPREVMEATASGGFPKLFSFSENQNVLLIVPDATPGTLLPDLLSEDPTLREAFSGFVYYGNTAAVGTFTLSNTAALLGGPAYAPREVNRRSEGTIAQVVAEAYDGLLSKLEQNDYSTNVIGPSIVDCDELAKADRCGHTEASRDFLYDTYDFEMVNAFDKRLLFLLSVFKASPLAAKSMLYRSQYWETVFGQPPITQQSERYYEFLFVESLAQFSEVAPDGGGNGFIHLWLNVVIAPFFLDEECGVAYRAVDMWNMEARKDSTACLLKGLTRWFQWMKANGVYDNTKIIIAADHGAGDFGDDWYRGAVTPLLMVKDFDSQGDLDESEILMSNSDVLSIICSGLERGCEGVAADPTKTPNEDRAVMFSVTTHGNPDFARDSREFDIVRQYEIRGSVHDLDQWIVREQQK